MNDRELLFLLLGMNAGLAVGIVIFVVTLIAVYSSFHRRGLL